MTELREESPLTSPTVHQVKLAERAFKMANPPAFLQLIAKTGAILKYGFCVGAASLAFAATQTYQDKPRRERRL